MVLTHSTITETNDLEFSDYDFRILRDASIYSIDSPLYFWTISLSITSTSTRTKMQLCTGKYSENFSDNNGQGWTHSGSVVSSQSENGE